MRRTSPVLLRAILLVTLTFVVTATSPRPVNAVETTAPGLSVVRDVHLTYHAEIRSIKSTDHRLEVWMPLPRQSAQQKISALSIQSNLKYQIVDLRRFGNRAVYFHATSPLPRTATMTVSFDAIRWHESANLKQAARPLPEPTSGEFAPFLSPDRMIPIGGEIARVADKVVPRRGDSLRRAYAIYQYVTHTMTYVHKGKGVGHGNALFACNLHHGNCTDFHSLFIAMARSRGIPARFIIGLPRGKRGSGTIPGYHCWAEFYAGGVWVPIDAAKAWEIPAQHDYYFGHLDADRVAFTMGRDLNLVPRQNGRSLNYFIYPYAQLDGIRVPSREIHTTFTYQDLARDKSN